MIYMSVKRIITECLAFYNVRMKFKRDGNFKVSDLITTTFNYELLTTNVQKKKYFFVANTTKITGLFDRI